jgi:hypothetical protein
MNVVRLSVLRTDRFTLRKYSWYSLLSQPQGQSAAGSMKSTKNSNDMIRNRTRDFPVFSAVPKSTAQPRYFTCQINYIAFAHIFHCNSNWCFWLNTSSQELIPALSSRSNWVDYLIQFFRLKTMAHPAFDTLSTANPLSFWHQSLAFKF